jgi:hypothetical protein
MVVVARRHSRGVITGRRGQLDVGVVLLGDDEQKLGRVVGVRPALNLGQSENGLLVLKNTFNYNNGALIRVK